MFGDLNQRKQTLQIGAKQWYYKSKLLSSHKQEVCLEHAKPIGTCRKEIAGTYPPSLLE